MKSSGTYGITINHKELNGMDEKRLDEIVTDALTMHSSDWYEIIRLARLGLWAEKYAIPIVQAAQVHTIHKKACMEALDALPKKS